MQKTSEAVHECELSGQCYTQELIAGEAIEMLQEEAECIV